MNPEGLYPDGVKKLFPAIQRQMDSFEEMDFIARFNRRDVTLWSNRSGPRLKSRSGWVGWIAAPTQPAFDRVNAGIAGRLLEEGILTRLSWAWVVRRWRRKSTACWRRYGLDNPKPAFLHPDQLHHSKLTSPGSSPLDKTLSSSAVNRAQRLNPHVV